MSRRLPVISRPTRALGLMMGLFAWAVVPAHADVISFSPDGVSAPINITSMNFAAGNAVAVGGDSLAQGSTFQLDFQASLGSVTLSNGSLYSPTGLNSTGPGGYQITIVASVTERVTHVLTDPMITTFALASVQSPSSFVEIYYNPAVVASPYQGTGFNVGTDILSAVPTALLPSSGNFTYSESSPGVPVIQPFDQTGSGHFPGVNTVVGSGSASIGALASTVDPSFFRSPFLGLNFTALNSTPFEGTDPSKLFADIPGGVPPSFMPNIGSINGLTSGGGSDFQFQSQGNTSFFVPEPSAFALIAIGLAGLAGRAWRSRRMSPVGAIEA